jgi:hypothetical protein
LPGGRRFVQEAPNDLPKAGKTNLNKTECVLLSGNDSSVQICLILDKKRPEICVVYVCGSLNLRERKEEQEDGLYLPVERQPADEKLGDIFKGNESTNDSPVHCPSLQIWLGKWAV